MTTLKSQAKEDYMIIGFRRYDECCKSREVNAFSTKLL